MMRRSYAVKKRMRFAGFVWEGRGRVYDTCQQCGAQVLCCRILAHIQRTHPETVLAQFLERLRPGGLAQEGAET